MEAFKHVQGRTVSWGRGREGGGCGRWRRKGDGGVRLGACLQFCREQKFIVLKDASCRWWKMLLEGASGGGEGMLFDCGR